MTDRNQWSRRGGWVAACILAIVPLALAEPYFELNTETDWLAALYGDPPHILGVAPFEWEEYMFQWQNHLEQGEPYPPTQFLPPELYVYEGSGSGEYPENPGLVMVWGTDTGLPPGEYASAWKFDYVVDPDLSNAIITVTVYPPQWGVTGQITQVSFGIRDALGRTRSWYWNVGPAGVIPWNVGTTITIHASQTGLSAVSPPANGYMNTPGFDITTAQVFIVDENAQWVGGPMPVPPPGGPPGGLWNYWYNLQVRPQWQLTKWSQPPDPAQPDNVYYGWNEWSEWWNGPVVADDWVCTTPDPVTDVHWWGSFLGWKYPYPPPLPQHFHIQFWTDVPADPTAPDSFSHPGYVIWELWAYNYTTTWVGWDFDPRTQEYEACFRFDYVLSPGEYFYQEPGPNGQNIYWISISACDGGPPQTPHVFGWKTRPRDATSPAPDDAVVILDPVQPVIGSQYGFGFPLWWPTPDQSWDMAFELTTSPSAFKWDQPPDLWPTGLDVNATYYPYILADDFLCSRDGPITRIRIWGSWHDDFLPGDPSNVTFRLSFHSDIPAGPVPWSMPGDLLWLRDFPPGTFQVQPFATGLLEGFFNPPDQWWFPGDTICWLYEFNIPASEAFYQLAGDIYWLDVQALPMADTSFGWKTSFMHWNDDAVWAWGQDPLPVPGPWQELRYPPGHELQGQSIDLAFQLESEGLTGIKWSQPPVPYYPEDAFNGWDQYCMYYYQLAADDWFCDTDNPVTDIHWWGSFLGWYHRYLPPQGMPPAFHIAIWTDVPADPTQPANYSHPGVVLWETICTNYIWEFAGWDFDPRVPAAGASIPPEATFKFTQALTPDQWFWQEPGGNIYWLSIAALYPTGQVVDYPWGWKTRPRIDGSPAPDDAVWISDPPAPTIGSTYVTGGPLYYPTPADSWDLAFELTSVPRDRVVCEPQGSAINPFHPPTYWYDVTPDDFGRCDFHVRVFDPNPANYTNVSLPPTWQFAVHQLANHEWWASWWDPDCSDAIFTTFRFQFDNPNASAWSDWTTTIGNTNDPYDWVVDRAANHAHQPDGYGYRVHVPRRVPYEKWAQPPIENPDYPGYFYGWNEPSVYIGPQVVADDFKCCDARPIADIHWWGSYLHWMDPVPPPAAPIRFQLGLWTDVPVSPDNPWSHPGVLIRDWIVPRAALNEHFVGMDFHPDYGYEACFRYDFAIPMADWFYQPNTHEVFWLSIAAIYDLEPPPDQFWGWKTRRHFWNDDAVRIFAPLPPLPGQPFLAGQPIENAEGTWDMAFILTTPEPGPPVCVGDLNGDGQVSFGDINPFVLRLSSPAVYHERYPCVPDGNGDINGDGIVSFKDINPFVACLSNHSLPIPCPAGCNAP